MKVSISWLKQLVDLNISVDELIHLLPLCSVSIKDATDDSIELDMKGYNRGDLLSMRGVALEVAAITSSKVKFSDEDVELKYDVPEVRARVENTNLCPLYCLAKIESLKVEKSNDTWVKKLSDCGLRSINNVADVTNLVMLEYGQPMHAFDAKGVKDEFIIVRTAKRGERITTLDGKTRDLELGDLLIADSLNALGIAGVMGGKDCEVSDSTTSILLEAAIFDPVNIRKTAQRLMLPSEASKRFQHGLTRRRLLQALDAAIKMYENLGGKLTALSIVGDLEDSTKVVKLTQKKLNSLVGIDFKPQLVEEYLQKLHFKLKKIDGGWEVTVPYFRLDIELEEDLIEEVARMYGYEKIPAKELSGEIPKKIDQRLFDFIYKLKATLVDQGLTEIQTYSFYSSQVVSDFGFRISDLIKVSNPISSETEYLRNWISPNLLEVVAKNMRKGYKDIAIFEIGKVYLKQKSSLPDEKYYLAIALMNGSDNPIQELYQIYQKIESQLGNGIQEKPGLPNKEEYQKLFHPTRFIGFTFNGKDIGGIAELHPRIVNKFGIEKKVAILEIDLQSLL